MYLGAGLKLSIWPELTEYAGRIFWNMSKKNHSNDKVAQMIGQMANFKCGEGCFSTKYSSAYAKPKIWWQMVDDSSDHLKCLAVKMFSIIPHSVTCERNFSMLGFLYGKRRQRLNLNTVEMMAKIRYFLLSNVKSEVNSEETETEVKALVEKCGFFDEDDDENDENFFNNGHIVEPFEIPSHEVRVLIINKIVDVTNSVFTGEETIINDSLDDDDDENNEISEEELDFEIIANILPPINM